MGFPGMMRYSPLVPGTTVGLKRAFGAKVGADCATFNGNADVPDPVGNVGNVVIMRTSWLLWLPARAVGVAGAGFRRGFFLRSGIIQRRRVS
jgi:hypothetical protein